MLDMNTLYYIEYIIIYCPLASILILRKNLRIYNFSYPPYFPPYYDPFFCCFTIMPSTAKNSESDNIKGISDVSIHLIHFVQLIHLS